MCICAGCHKYALAMTHVLTRIKEVLSNWYMAVAETHMKTYENKDWCQHMYRVQIKTGITIAVFLRNSLHKDFVAVFSFAAVMLKEEVKKAFECGRRRVVSHFQSLKHSKHLFPGGMTELKQSSGSAQVQFPTAFCFVYV